MQDASETSGAVNLRGIIILGVDILEAAQEDENLVWKAVPDDVEADGEKGGPIIDGRAGG